MKNLLPNMHPLTFTTSAVIVSYLLIDDLSMEEQAALGSWFNVVGDILSSSSSWLAVLQSRNVIPSNDEINNDNDEKEMLKKSIEKIQKILDENNDSEIRKQ